MTPPAARLPLLLPTRTLLVLTCALLAACGEDGPGDAFRVETFEGVPHTVAIDTPEDPGATLELLWTAPPPGELMDGEAWADPLHVRADDRGVAVLDPQLAQIHLFSVEGERLHSIGRQGQGPGELRSPRDVALHGDTVLVQDAYGLAPQLFRRGDGSFLGSLGGGSGTSFDLYLLGSGAGIVRPVLGRDGGDEGEIWLHLALDAPERAGADDTEDGGAVIEHPGPHPLQPQVPEGGESCWRRGTAGPHLVEADCTFPLLRILDPTGRVVREHRVERDPVRTSEATLTQIAEEVEEAVRANTPPGPHLAPLIERVVGQERERYRWTPAIRGVAGSPSGERIVLWEQPPPIFEPEEAVLHLFDAEGRYLQRHVFGEMLSAVALTDDRLYLLVPDPETDLKRLEAYRLP